MVTKSKRILLLTTSYLPLIGGSEMAIKEVTDRLRDFEFDLVTACYSQDLPAEEKMGSVHVFRVGNGWNLSRFLLPKNFLPLAIFLKARSLVKSGRDYAGVHVWQASQAGGAAWLLKWFYPRLTFMLTLQEGKDLHAQNWLTRFFRRFIIRRADRATAISQYLADYLLTIKKNLPVRLIPNGVDLQNFSRQCRDEEIARWRDQLGILPGDKVIISVSRLTYKNGLDNLIRAVSILNRKNPRERYRLLLAGDGEGKKEYQKLAEELNLAERVIFAGTVRHAHLAKYLKIADVFARPSRSEGLGSSFLEAMAAGIPIVGSAVGGIPDFLADGQTGLFCDPADPESIAQKIGVLMEDGEMRKKIIKNAQDLVRQKYDWDQIAKEYEKAYEGN